MKRSILFATLTLGALAAAACGGPSASDDTDNGPDATPVDRRGTAAVVAGDFAATGIFTTIAAPDGVTTNAVAGVVGADPALRLIGSELFIVNRFGAGGDNLTILDATTLALVDQISTGPGSNPQDVAEVGHKLYVPALGTASLLVIDRDHPDTIGEIDLSTLDTDGFPDCVSAFAAGERVYVACGLLHDFYADGNGKIAVIDTTDDSVATVIDMPARNPAGWMIGTSANSGFDGDILVPTVPDYQDYSTGCVVRISTGATPTATCGPTNGDLGGFVNKLVFDEDRVWAVVNAFDAHFSGSGWLVRFDGAGVAGDALTPDTQVIQDIAICGGHVFLTDKDFTANGLRVFTVGGMREETSAVLDVGLPPAFGNAISCVE